MAKKLDAGFSLLEVMIALTIFAVFTSMYITSEGYNISDSVQLKEELTLRTLCEQKVNEILLDPPDYEESLTLKADSGKFEDNEQYKWTAEFKRFELPLQSDGEDTTAMEKKIMETVAKSIKEILWQVEVTVINNETNFSYSMSFISYNHKAKIKLQL